MAAAGFAATKAMPTNLDSNSIQVPALHRHLLPMALLNSQGLSLPGSVKNSGLGPGPTRNMATGRCRESSSLGLCIDFCGRKGMGAEEEMAGRRSFVVRAEEETAPARFYSKKYTRTGQDTIEMVVKSVCKSGANVSETLRIDGRFLNAFDWFNVLDGIGRRRQWALALEVFRWIQVQKWYTPDNGYYAKLVSILGKERQYKMALTIFKEVRKIGCRPDTSLYNSVMTVHLRSEDKEKGFLRACALLETMKQIRRCQPNVVTYNILARSAAQLGHHESVDQLLKEMSTRKLQPDNYTFNGIMHAYGSTGEIDRMEDMLKHMRECKVKPDEVAFNTLIDAYGKAQKFDKMGRAFASMTLKRKQQIQPLAKTYNCMITHYGNAGLLEECEVVFKGMKKVGARSNFITYEVMIGAYGRCSQFDKMNYCVRQMRRAGFEPQSSTLNKILDCYCHHGMIDKSELLLKQSEEEYGVEATPLSYEIVIRAHRKARQRDEMQALLESMKTLGLKPTKATALFFKEKEAGAEAEGECQNSQDDKTAGTVNDLDEMSRLTAAEEDYEEFLSERDGTADTANENISKLTIAEEANGSVLSSLEDMAVAAA